MIKSIIILTLIYNLTYAKNYRNAVGVAVINSSTIYKEESSRTFLVPLIKLNYKNFFIKYLDIGYKIDKNIKFILKPNFSEYLDIIDKSLEAGFRIKYPIKKYNLSIDAFKNITNFNKGYYLSTSFSYGIFSPPFMIVPKIKIKYESEKMSQYYYHTSSISSASLSLFNSIFLTKNISFSTLINYTIIDDKIEKSSIIDKDKKSFILVGITKKF